MDYKKNLEKAILKTENIYRKLKKIQNEYMITIESYYIIAEIENELNELNKYIKKIKL